MAKKEDFVHAKPGQAVVFRFLMGGEIKELTGILVQDPEKREWVRINIKQTALVVPRELIVRVAD